MKRAYLTILFATFTTLFPLTNIAFGQGDGHSLDAADGSPTDVVYVDNEGNVGIGTINPEGSRVKVYTNSLNTEDSFNGLYAYTKKISGLTDFNDFLCGIRSLNVMDQVNGETGHIYGMYGLARLLNGSVGNAASGIKSIMGGAFQTDAFGGTITGGAYGSYSLSNIDYGTVSGAVYGSFSYADVEPDAIVQGNVYGGYFKVDSDSDPGGKAYGIYVDIKDNVDYGLYVTTGANNYFGGNVGIGTTNAKETLHVMGQGRFEHTIGVVEIDGITNSPDNGYVRGSILFSRDGDLEYDDTTDLFTLGSGSNNDFAAIMHRSDGQLGFYTGAAGSFTSLNNTDFRNNFERITINNVGNIGIGTLTPDHKLDVKGTIRAEEVKVDTGWSDFVFDETYNLPSLTEVESFIKKNKHLPDIPSAREVKEEGLAMSEMMTKQMQKIEELTLYIIELEKRIASLEANNN